MTDQLSGSESAKAISNPFGTFIEWLAELLLPEGPALLPLSSLPTHLMRPQNAHI
jgi:hypothetical protein